MSRRKKEVTLEHMHAVASIMRLHAGRGSFDGRATYEGLRYMSLCRRDDRETGTRLIFTRDTGHHSSGWLKNPDYERCLHLSLSPLPPLILLPEKQLSDPDWTTWQLWCKAFFVEDLKEVWAESPKSQVGRDRGVWHWRLFCDQRWKPIKLRGEVYSSEFTELGWKSASQVFEETGKAILSAVDPT